MSTWRERGREWERRGEGKSPRGQEGMQRGGEQESKRAREKEARVREGGGASKPFYSGPGLPGCCLVTVGRSIPGCCQVTVGVEFRQNANTRQEILWEDVTRWVHR